MKKRHIHIVSQHLGSIGEITKDLVEGLQGQCILTQELLGECPKRFDILLAHFITPVISKDSNFKRFKKRVLIQPIDGTEITPETVTELNKYDLIITPAKAGMRIMKKNGVKTSIKVIPNYFKPDMLTPVEHDILGEIPTDKIVLYHESTFHPRKGIELLYEGYIKAFSDTPWADKVILICKDMSFNETTFKRIESLKRDTIKLQKKYKNPAKILKISQHCSWDTLKKLWSNADIYVSLAKIEGFGIPLLRMAVLGKPIIVLENTNCGYMDYLNETNSYLIPTIQKKATDEHMYLYKPTTEWGVPANIQTVVNTLQQAVKDFDNNKSKKVSKATLKNMTYENIIKKYLLVLNSL